MDRPVANLDPGAVCHNVYDPRQKLFITCMPPPPQAGPLRFENSPHDPTLAFFGHGEPGADAEQLAQALPYTRGSFATAALGDIYTALPGDLAALGPAADMAEYQDLEESDDDYDSEVDEASETVAPADLIASPSRPSQADDDAQGVLDFFYCLLEFPSAYLPIKELAFRMGRDIDLEHRLARRKNRLRNDNEATQEPDRKRKRSVQDVDGDEPEAVDEDSLEYVEDPDEYRSPLWTIGGVSRLKFGRAEGEEDFVYIYTSFNDDTGESDLKSISKEHLRFYMNESGWNMQVWGRNGVFLNGTFHEQGAELELADKDTIAVKNLEFKFHLTPYVEDYYDGTKPREFVDMVTPDIVPPLPLEPDTTTNGNTASNTPAASVEAEKDPLLAEAPAKPVKLKLKIDVSGQKPEEKQKVPKSPSKKKPELDPENLLKPGEKLPERRGPGRPPANGKMSKREMRLRQKAQKEGKEYDAMMAKETREKSTTEAAAEGEEGAKEDSAKKKKKSRKRSTTVGEETGDQDAATPAGLSEPKADDTDPQPPREPSPKLEDYTEEQLAKPTGTYQDFLYTVLSESERPLALQQIYNAIKNRWPHFRFGVESNGWESSVRHNLQGCNYFRKARKEGKGHAWEINPEVPFVSKTTKKPETHFIKAPTQTPNPQYQARPAGAANVPGQTTTTPYSSQFRSNIPPLPGQGQPVNVTRVPATPSNTTHYSSPYIHNTTPSQVRPGQLAQTPGQATSVMPGQQRPANTVAPQTPQQRVAGHLPQGAQFSNPQLPQTSQQRPLVPPQTPQQRVMQGTLPSNLQRPTTGGTAGSMPTVGIRPGQPIPANLNQARPAIHNVTTPQSFVSSSYNAPRPATPSRLPLLIMDQIRANQVPTLFTDVKNKFVENLAPNERSSKAASFDMAIRWVMENSLKEDFKSRMPVQLDSGTVKVVDILRGLISNTMIHEAKQMRKQQNAQTIVRTGSNGGLTNGTQSRASTPGTPVQAQSNLATPGVGGGSRPASAQPGYTHATPQSSGVRNAASSSAAPGVARAAAPATGARPAANGSVQPTRIAGSNNAVTKSGPSPSIGEIHADVAKASVQPTNTPAPPAPPL